MLKKRKITKQILIGLFGMLVCGQSYGFAMPTGSHDLQNISAIAQNGNVMDITGKGNAVAKWQDFSLKQNETVNFKGMNNVLNIVDGNKFSDIRGNINGQGVNVFLVNPNGVLFGDSSTVNVGSLTVSTQELTDDMSQNFVKNGTISTDASKLGIGNVTMVGSVNADTIKITGNNISLVNTSNLNAPNVSLETATDGFINVLKGQDSSKLNITGGTLRDDFEEVDSQEKLENLKSDGHYMLTSDINVDNSWNGIKGDKPEEYLTGGYHWVDDEKVYDSATRDNLNGIVLNGMGHDIKGLTEKGLFQSKTKVNNSEISNISISGNEYANHDKNGSAIILNQADGIKVDNIISNIKNADTTSANSGSTHGLFGNIDNSTLNNIVNNTSFVDEIKDDEGYTTNYTFGNIVNFAKNTNITNAENNGAGNSGIASYMYGGNLKNSINNGHVNKSGLVNYYYNYYYPVENDWSVRKFSNIEISGNKNNGEVSKTDGYNDSGHAGLIYTMFLADQNDTPFSAILKDNINYGKVNKNDSAGIVSQVYITMDNANSQFIVDNAVNYGTIEGSNASAGIIAKISGGKTILKNTKNYGDVFSKDYQYASGGIIGDIHGDAELFNVENHGKIGIQNDYTSHAQQMGGIIGMGTINKMTLEKVRNYGDITSGNCVGGLMGLMSINDVTIKDSFNKGDLKINRNKGTNDTQWSIGGLIGHLDVNKPYYGYENMAFAAKFENVFNTGNIYSLDGTGMTSVGGLIGVESGHSDGFVMKNSFNTGKIQNAKYFAGGLIGNSGSNSTFENVYSTGDIVIHDGTTGYSDENEIGTLFGYVRDNITLNNVYTSGDLSFTTGKDKQNSMVGEIANNAEKVKITLNNVYSTKDTKAVQSNEDNAVFEENNLKTISGKKSSEFVGFDIDTTGENDSAVWRIYEGYTNPLLKVFMNKESLVDDKTVTENGKEQTFIKDEAAKDIGSRKNFFTEDIDYSKDSHFFDGRTGKDFSQIVGEEAGEYSTKIYSDQLGFDFKTTKNNDTLTMTIKEKPSEPVPTPEPISEPTSEPTPASPKPILTTPFVNNTKIEVYNQSGSYNDIAQQSTILLNKKEIHQEKDEDEIIVVETK